MNQYLGLVSILVDDYDKAIRYFTEVLGFDLLEDTPLSDIKRWVVVSPPGAKECGLLLAKAATDYQKEYIGNQTGGRVFLFLYTDHFDEFFNRLVSHDTKIIHAPRIENYGKVAVFQDLYGNFWDLIESKKFSTFDL
jgi:catechol 2,3-dioxygenase-like lactoylglutathione lyase family enzyme